MGSSTQNIAAMILYYREQGMTNALEPCGCSLHGIELVGEAVCVARLCDVKTKLCLRAMSSSTRHSVVAGGLQPILASRVPNLS